MSRKKVPYFPSLHKVYSYFTTETSESTKNAKQKNEFFALIYSKYLTNYQVNFQMTPA